jgi:hypothetical protein
MHYEISYAVAPPNTKNPYVIEITMLKFRSGNQQVFFRASAARKSAFSREVSGTRAF